MIPIIYEESLLANLLNRRCGNPKKTKIWGECDPQCGYHSKNNKNIHYTELDSHDKYYIAKRWIKFLLEEKIQKTYNILAEKVVGNPKRTFRYAVGIIKKKNLRSI
ncbi:MAG: hypothetical protein ACOC56_04800 [Atribacterota bacterium]